VDVDFDAWIHYCCGLRLLYFDSLLFACIADDWIHSYSIYTDCFILFCFDFMLFILLLI
jgi:hypothetical protein